jgi:hypothetical protein
MFGPVASMRKFAPQELAALLESKRRGSTKITSNSRCAIALYRVSYNTLGGAGEATTANAVGFDPSGTDATCAGARPVLLYAHGTSVQTAFDMARLNDNAEGRLIAAMLAAQGGAPVVQECHALAAATCMAMHAERIMASHFCLNVLSQGEIT